MYDVGMYGGSFNPPHLGHVKCMIEAANQCKELHIIISFSRNRDEISEKLRYRWIHNLTKHIGNVKIHLLEDTSESKEGYDQQAWEDGAIEVKRMIAKPVNVVFCGSDYQAENPYKQVYSNSIIKYFDRNEIPISSTVIRENPFMNWEFIPQIVRPYYVKKVLLIGIESTGKSTLAANLANCYNTNCVREIGREICDLAGKEDTMIPEDFMEILLKHKVEELDAIKMSNKLLIVDTDCLTTKFFARFLGSSEESISMSERLADAIHEWNCFELILFLEPDIAFVQDGTRNEKFNSDRIRYNDQLKTLLQEAKVNFKTITGDYQERFRQACKFIDQLI